MNIAVLTAGGDSPGINAFIRSLYYIASRSGHTVYGILRGWEGLVNGEFLLLTENEVKNIAFTGGSILKNTKKNPLADGANIGKIELWCSQLNIGILIVCGSFDTLRVALELSKRGIAVVGIPQTIDNDISGTEYTLGFYSSVKNIVTSVETIRTTNESHERDVLIEIMGREAGWLTVFSALSTKVEAFYIPEMGEVSAEMIASRFRSRREKGFCDNIALVSEGVSFKGIPRVIDSPQIYGDADLTGITFKIADRIVATGYEKPKVVILSYIQRGGAPDVFDVVLADRFALEAVNCAVRKQSGIAVGVREGKICTYPLADAVSQYKLVSSYFIELAGMLID